MDSFSEKDAGIIFVDIMPTETKIGDEKQAINITGVFVSRSSYGLEIGQYKQSEKREEFLQQKDYLRLKARESSDLLVFNISQFKKV